MFFWKQQFFDSRIHMLIKRIIDRAIVIAKKLSLYYKVHLSELCIITTIFERKLE